MHQGWTPSFFHNTAPRKKGSNFLAAVVLQFLFAFLIISSGCFLASPLPASDPNVERINAIVSELRTELGMPHQIQITIVPVNDRMVSIEHISGKPGDVEGFIMCFDENFLASLDEEELRAAVAHELGHVWIFSHHPYLQTEALANEIAMRVVSRESLKKIYNKLWAHVGVHGNLDEFLGAEKPDIQQVLK